MDELVRGYADKLASHGLCDPGAALVGGLDADLAWSRPAPECRVLERVLAGLNTCSILFARPAEPYASILARQTATGISVLRPEDCETRTFLHDIPVVHGFGADAILDALKRRKGAVIAGQGIVAHGSVSPEQAFVTFSSICFASFVKWFVDILRNRTDAMAAEAISFSRRIAQDYREGLLRRSAGACLAEGPLADPAVILRAMAEAGLAVVECRLVDSFFGNISFRLGNTLYISQTASSMDCLPGCIDACPLDGSSCAGITASSELTAHREVLTRTEARALLHGHPRFAVIASMLCEADECPERGACHLRCPRTRLAGGVPVVPGEVGTGRYGLCNTLPPALDAAAGAIVHGHGLFTTGHTDFREAFSSHVRIESECVREVLAKMGTEP